MVNWVVEITNQLNTMTTDYTHKHCIYKVPAFISDLNKKVYTPKSVSFGPYHHGKEHLKPMEEHKKRALLHFLRRSQRSLECIVESFSKMVEDLKDAYDSLDESWRKDSEEFLRLMIMDGCFTLEIFRAAEKTPDDYDKNDPIFGNHGKLYIMPFIKRDMLLIENQLPMMVLYKLMAICGEENSSKDEDFINRQVLRFCNSETPVSNMGKCFHVLDAFRKSLFSIKEKNKKSKDKQHSGPEDDDFGLGSGVTPLARELNEAGIRFKRTKNRCLIDISFKKGVLKLPTFIIDDTTESTFLNLIAFERCHVGAGNQVTSFICFMDNLIDDALDINLLQTRRIIQNFTGSDKEAANLFNTMSKDLIIDPASSLHGVHTKISKYCNKKRNRWRANLIHTYFTNPWTLISILAAVFLFALTISQTVYGILDYYNN